MPVTFKEVLEQERDNKRKSDLTNLANARLRLEQSIADSEKLIKEIDEAAEDPNTPIERIKQLYERVRHVTI